MKNYYNQIRFLTTAVLIFLVANPSKAANRQIAGVKLNSTNKGIELRLKTAGQSGNPSSFFTVSGDNSLEANLINTELKLPQGTNFHRENPFPGIAEIAVRQLDKNNTQISISGEKGVAVKPTLQEQEGEIVLSLTPDAKTKKSSLQSTLVRLKSSFKEIIAQLPTQKKQVDSSRSNNPGRQNSNVLVPNPEIVISDKDNIDLDKDKIADNHRRSFRNNRRYLPRAVAPPVGDMAVSNIDASPELIDLGSSAIVPRLVLRDAPVREVLSLLARSAGLNLVFTDTGNLGEEDYSEEGNQEKTISLDLENEPVQEVFNSVLLVSGMSANRKRNTIYVGTNLPYQARNLVSRTVRLNQVKAENAALFLASHGAEGQRLTTEVEEIVDPETGRVSQRTEKPAQLENLGLDEEDDGTTAAVLKGLRIATDDRLNSITLIGEPRKVQMATTFLTQLDARRRQVAVNVKVIDVNLSNTDEFNSSFSFGVNNTYFTQDNGVATLRFGDNPPGRNNNPDSDQFRSPVRNVLNPKKFLASLTAQVTSGNAKILTDPTLVVQEGQEATVKLVEEVIKSVESEIDSDSGVRTITPVIGEAGLTLNVNIEQIDDNGFVSLSVNPKVTSLGQIEEFNSGDGAVNELQLLSNRELNSGLIRLRDNQTLILSGIIQDQERTDISKVPILGDIPLLGSLFRSSEKTNERAEVIVVLTPQVIDEQSELGSNYRPGKDAREMLRERGFDSMPNSMPNDGQR
ncbi:MAG: secretin N-terminal domain-containing protein [Xenococcaceae cyanobacterium MO_188.B32]|nr:secretin N-terminal domain-containing protein [Xenococcaceae cyanobacterium MO_188.B32]